MYIICIYLLDNLDLLKTDLHSDFWSLILNSSILSTVLLRRVIYGYFEQLLRYLRDTSNYYSSFTNLILVDTLFNLFINYCYININ